MTSTVPLDPEPDLSWLVVDELAERDPESGLLWTEDDELAATAWSDFTATATPGQVRELDRLIHEPLWPLPSLEDVWARTERIAPRPLPGISGVTGPSLAAPLAALDVATLSPAQLVEAMTGAERLIRWAQSVQLSAIRAFADYAVITDEDSRDHPLPELPGGSHTVETGFGTQREIETFCADGIGAALGVSFTAGQQLIDAAYCASDVPLVRQLLASGRIDVARVKVLARELASVGYGTPETCEFVDELLDQHAELTPRKLEGVLRTAVMARSPEDARDVRQRAERSRGLWLFRKPAGMATLNVRLTAEEAQLAYQTLNAAGWQLHDQALVSTGRNCELGEFRSFDNFRADAFMKQMRDLQLRFLRREDGLDESVPDAPGKRWMDPARVMLHLYMDAATLVGFEDRPATLLGYGPIDADRARELAADAQVIRLLTDPFTGEVKAIDIPSYRVPRILRWAVQSRDRGCVFPGCDVPAYDTQLDHIDPHPFARKLRKAFATGRTSFANLQQLCVRHHYVKTHGGWVVQSTAGSRLEWISPTGHSYRRNPEWGPPKTFWDDHHPGLPIDAPPTARPEPEQSGDCPF